jgi:hypothetical protein
MSTLHEKPCDLLAEATSGTGDDCPAGGELRIHGHI